MNLQSVKVNKKGIEQDAIEAVVTLVTYWSTPPETLPALSETLVELTPDEVSLIDGLSSFRQPPIGEELLPLPGGLKLDPFAL